MSNKLTKFNVSVNVGNVMGTQGLAAVLGQKGIKMKEFTDEFTKLSKEYKPGTMVRCIISSEGKGGKFFLKVKNSPVSDLIKKTINLSKGSGKAGIQMCASITEEQIQEIVKLKAKDTNGANLESVKKTILGTIKSMGIELK